MPQPKSSARSIPEGIISLIAPSKKQNTNEIDRQAADSTVPQCIRQTLALGGRFSSSVSSLSMNSAGDGGSTPMTLLSHITWKPTLPLRGTYHRKPADTSPPSAVRLYHKDLTDFFLELI